VKASGAGRGGHGTDCRQTAVQPPPLLLLLLLGVKHRAEMLSVTSYQYPIRTDPPPNK